MKIRPQIMAAMLLITLLAVLVVVLVPQHADKTVGSALTALGMLAMKLIEGE